MIYPPHYVPNCFTGMFRKRTISCQTNSALGTRAVTVRRYHSHWSWRSSHVINQNKGEGMSGARLERSDEGDTSGQKPPLGRDLGKDEAWPTEATVSLRPGSEPMVMGQAALRKVVDSLGEGPSPVFYDSTH